MILALAARNLRRATWRSALAGLALALATALLVVALALVRGLFENLVGGVTRRGDGDALVQRRSPDGRQVPIDDGAALAAALRRLSVVAAASPRLRLQGILLAGDRRAGVEIVGVDPATEPGVTDIRQTLIAGGPLTAGSTTGDELLLGRTLALRLGVGAGESVTLLTRSTDGLPATAHFQVAGVFSGGDPRRDGLIAFAGIARAGAIAALSGAAHEIGLSFVPPADALRATAAVAATLPSGAGLVALPWQERFPALAEAVRFSQATTWWLIGLLYASAGLVTLIVLVLGAHERRREHAVCLALGIPAGVLRRVIAAEALLLGTAAVAVGSFAGTAVAAALRGRGIELGGLLGPVGYAGGTIQPVLRAVPRTDDLLRTGAALLAVCASAGWLSGARLAHLEPARVIAGRDAA